MSKKKLGTIVGSAFVIALIIFLLFRNFVDKEETKKDKTNEEETKEEKKEEKEEPTNSDTIVIDYKTYQELRSEVYENETFGILIMDSNDEASLKFKEEIIYSFKDRKAKVYEIDTSQLNDVDMSSLIADVTKIMKYKEPTLMTPTLLVSKKGKIVYKQELLVYSPEIIKNLDKNKIE